MGMGGSEVSTAPFPVIRSCASCYFRREQLCSLRVEGEVCPTYRPCDRDNGLCACPVASEQTPGVLYPGKAAFG
jgi:hypothetical protein